MAAAWARLAPAQRYVAQRSDGPHKMRRGETLAGVAAASGVSLARLLAANHWTAGHEAARGETIRIPAPASRADAGGALAAADVSAPSAVVVAPLVPIAAPNDSTLAKLPPPPKEPVSQRQAESTALLPAVAPTGNSDTTNYDVAADDSVTVQASETLGHFADWSKSSLGSLLALNKLHKNAMVGLGRKVKLDFSHVSEAEFVAARRDYHRQQQETFFATHRIAGTDNYTIKRGESLWTIAQQHGDLPVWLVSQYNPDMRFSEVRPGATITLPRVAVINRQ